VFIKALCCAAVLFVVLAALGIWLQNRRCGSAAVRDKPPKGPPRRDRMTT
jgi:hypothetical protein